MGKEKNVQVAIKKSQKTGMVNEEDEIVLNRTLIVLHIVVEYSEMCSEFLENFTRSFKNFNKIK
jgi:hypothetical protein